MAPEKPPGGCLRQQELVDDVRRHLMRISELTRAVAKALENKDETLAAELDKEVDLELGLKERGMGALHQHRKEHFADFRARRLHSDFGVGRSACRSARVMRTRGFFAVFQK